MKSRLVQKHWVEAGRTDETKLKEVVACAGGACELP